MRNFSHFQSTSTIPFHFAARLTHSHVGHLFHNLHSRHIAQDLLLRDDHLLADMGLTRGDVEHATHLARYTDAVASLVNSRRHHMAEIEQLCLCGDSNPSPVDNKGLDATNLRSRLDNVTTK